MAANCRKPSPSCWRKEIADSWSPLSGFQKRGTRRSRSGTKHPTPPHPTPGLQLRPEMPRGLCSVCELCHITVVSSVYRAGAQSWLSMSGFSAGSVLQNFLLESLCTRQVWQQSPGCISCKETGCFLVCFRFLLPSFPAHSSGAMGLGSR